MTLPRSIAARLRVLLTAVALLFVLPLPAAAQPRSEGARSMLLQPPGVYQKTGRRLLHISRLALQRTLTLSLAYRTTGDAAFARRAEEEMLAAAAFASWGVTSRRWIPWSGWLA